MERSIQHRRWYAHSPEEVWECLTDPELIGKWLMKNDFKLQVGSQFCFETRPLADMDFDGIVYCTVLEVVPFRRLSYSWKLGPGNGVITIDSVVAYTLHAKDGGTELELVHDRFKEMKDLRIFHLMEEGWLKNINKIPGLINTTKHGTA